MILANQAAEVTLTMLNKCCEEVEPMGPWNWQCAVQNTARLPLSVTYADGFLHLAAGAGVSPIAARMLERAVRSNCALGGGVKIAADGAGRAFKLCADLVVLNELELLTRLEWAFEGFHEGLQAMRKLAASQDEIPSRSAHALAFNLPELLDTASWECAERGDGTYAVKLDAESAPRARVSMSGGGTSLSVEVVRAQSAAAATPRALSLFLLAASGSLRFVRACAAESGDGKVFDLEVTLPATPATEELNHGLKALSLAYRLCAREANLLLDESAACCYLAVRGHATNHQQPDGEEN
ncbi:MAG: hypothetical protein ACLQHF_07630 [Terracidiphilus sp.]